MDDNSNHLGKFILPFWCPTTSEEKRSPNLSPILILIKVAKNLLQRKPLSHFDDNKPPLLVETFRGRLHDIFREYHRSEMNVPFPKTDVASFKEEITNAFGINFCHNPWQNVSPCPQI